MYLISTKDYVLAKSTDGDASWTDAGPVDLQNGSQRFGLALDASVVAVAPSSPETLYSSGSDGTYTSTDGGRNWTAVDLVVGQDVVSDNVAQLVIDPVSPRIVFAITADSSVYETTNGGAAWTAADSGLPVFTSEDELSLDFAPLDGPVIWERRTASLSSRWNRPRNCAHPQ